MSAEFPVCTYAELAGKTALAVDAGDTRIAVFLHEGRVYALNETCPHRGGPLHAGEVSEGIVRCPWHLWQFDLETGRSPLNPNSCVPTYPARVENGIVLARVPGKQVPQKAVTAAP